MVMPSQPIELIMLKGNKARLTKAEIEARRNSEVKAPVGEGEPPDYLTANQKREFKRYADQLIALNIYSDLDAETLAAYIVAVDDFKKLTKQIRKLKPKQDGYLDTLKALSIERDRAHKIFRSSAGDLGLTISSRCKLVVPKVEEPEENKFKRFVK